MAGSKFRVVDSSFILSHLLPDENLESVEKEFSRFETGEIEFIGTKILPFEVLNGLWTAAVIKRRISKKQLKDLADGFIKMEIRLIGVEYLPALELAVSKNLTFYDACYLYLSNTKKIPLLTFDQALQKLA